MDEEGLLQPWTVPLEGGWFQEINAKGNATGVWVDVSQGNELPGCAPGFTWRKRTPPTLDE